MCINKFYIDIIEYIIIWYIVNYAGPVFVNIFTTDSM